MTITISDTEILFLVQSIQSSFTSKSPLTRRIRYLNVSPAPACISNILPINCWKLTSRRGFASHTLTRPSWNHQIVGTHCCTSWVHITHRGHTSQDHEHTSALLKMGKACPRHLCTGPCMQKKVTQILRPGSCMRCTGCCIISWRNWTKQDH